MYLRSTCALLVSIGPALLLSQAAQAARSSVPAVGFILLLPVRHAWGDGPLRWGDEGR